MDSYNLESGSLPCTKMFSYFTITAVNTQKLVKILIQGFLNPGMYLEAYGEDEDEENESVRQQSPLGKKLIDRYIHT